eukprot:73846_1
MTEEVLDRIKQLIETKHINTVEGYVRIVEKMKFIYQHLKDLILFFYAKPMMMNVKYKSAIKSVFIEVSPLQSDWNLLQCKIFEAYGCNASDIFLVELYHVKYGTIRVNNWNSLRWDEYDDIFEVVTHKYISDGFIRQANKGLRRYYVTQSVHYDNNFAIWCDDTDMDDEAMIEELEESPNENYLLEFDEDFPLHCIDNDKKNAKIIEIIKHCFYHIYPYDDIKTNIPLFDDQTFNIPKEDIIKCIELYRKQCPQNLFNSMISIQDSEWICIVLAIGGNEFEYLQTLLSDYFQCAIKYNCKQKKSLSVAQYVTMSDHFKVLNNIKKTAKGEKPSQIVEYVIEEFSGPTMFSRLQFNPLSTIEDSLQHTANYVCLAIEWVHERSKSIYPFQFDLCFVYPSTKGKGIGKFFDCIGDIKEKLLRNKLKYVATNININEIDIFHNTFDELRQQMSEKDYPFRKRMISFIDRRRLQNDTIFMYEPPENARYIPNNAVPEWYLSSSRTCILPNINYNENEAHNYNGCVRTKKQLINANITSRSHCNGGLVIFSFHAKQNDNIKCYMYINGQNTRFLPNDIINVLPLLFDMDWNDGTNKSFVETEKKSNELINTIANKLIDKSFEKWRKLNKSYCD